MENRKKVIKKITPQAVMAELSECRKAEGITLKQVRNRLDCYDEAAVHRLENPASDLMFTSVVNYARAIGYDVELRLMKR